MTMEMTKANFGRSTKKWLNMAYPATGLTTGEIGEPGRTFWMPS